MRHALPGYHVSIIKQYHDREFLGQGTGVCQVANILDWLLTVLARARGEFHLNFPEALGCHA